MNCRSAVTAGQLLAVLSVLSFSTMAAESAAGADGRACPDMNGRTYVAASEVQGRSAVECRLTGILVEGDGMAASIPPVGFSVTATEIRTDAPEASLSVGVDEEGRVSVTAEGGDLDEETPRPVPELECTQTAYAFFSNQQRWTSIPQWYIQRSGIPTGELNPDSAITAIRNAFSHWPQSYNTCGMSDNVGISGAYQGDTPEWAHVDYDATHSSICRVGQLDGTNVISFGDRPGATLATTCAYGTTNRSPNYVVEAEIEVDRTARDWTTSGAFSGCKTANDLENVMTHEFGHWFGMHHVGDTGSGLTMYGESPPCTTHMRTLGKGDLLGMQVLY